MSDKIILGQIEYKINEIDDERIIEELKKEIYVGLMRIALRIEEFEDVKELTTVLSEDIAYGVGIITKENETKWAIKNTN